MQLDWTTFVLEIINFLILVWILKRFLYAPVLNAIAKRKAAIEQTLADATKQKTDAQGLEEQYRTRLDTWEQEKAKLREQMLDEVRAERERQLAELQTSLEQAREKSRVLDERRAQELQRTLADSAYADATAFAARLLERLATPALEARLIEVAIEDLTHLDDARKDALRTAFTAPELKLKITTAFPLPTELRRKLEHAINAVTGSGHAPEYAQDVKLLAGMRAAAGPWVLRANLLDELKYFTEAVPHGRSS